MTLISRCSGSPRKVPVNLFVGQAKKCKSRPRILYRRPSCIILCVFNFLSRRHGIGNSANIGPTLQVSKFGCRHLNIPNEINKPGPCTPCKIIRHLDVRHTYEAWVFCLNILESQFVGHPLTFRPGVTKFPCRPLCIQFAPAAFVGTEAS